MILVKEMPKSGQFVAVWEWNHNGILNSGAYKWEDDKLFYWWHRCDEWEECSPEDLIKIGAKYIVLKLDNL